VGQRSWGGGRGTFYNEARLVGNNPSNERTEFMAQTNAEMLVMVQLETATSFSNLEDILKVDGIDAFAWGPNDLAQSMGLTGKPEHPDVLAAQERVQNRIHQVGKKMSSDLTVTLALPTLILDAAERFRDAHL